MRTRTWHLLLICCTGILCYYPAAGHGFGLDDAYVLTQLPAPDSGIKGLLSVFGKLFGQTDYRPISVFTFALEQWAFDSIQPGISHIINILLFLATAVLIYQTLLLLPGKHAAELALIATLIFTAHPVHSSVVASLKNRDNILSMLLGMSAWYYFLQAILKERKAWFAVSVLMLTLAVFAKRDALSFLFIIPFSVLVFFPQHRNRIFLFASAALLLSLFARMIAEFYIAPEPGSVIFTENPSVADWTLPVQFAQSLQTVGLYLKFMVVPTGYWFYFGYDMLPLHNLASLPTLGFLLLFLAMCAAAYWTWKRDRRITFGIGFFYLALIYCANFIVPVAGIIADRYAYIASLGFCIGIAALFVFGFDKKTIPSKKNKANPRSMLPAYGLSAALVLFFGYFTLDRTRDWKDAQTLFDADMPHLVRSFEANRIAASNYFKFGIENSPDPASRQAYIRQGLQYALQAQAVYPDNQYINETIGQAYFNTGQPALAILQLRQTLQRFDTSRVSLEVLGDIYYLRGQADSSAYFYSSLLKLDPEKDIAYFKYLRALVKAGKTDNAEAFSRALSEQHPGWYLPDQCLSYVLLEKRDSLDGLRYYARSFEKGFRNPEYARQTSDKLLRLGDTTSVRKLRPYLNLNP